MIGFEAEDQIGEFCLQFGEALVEKGRQEREGNVNHAMARGQNEDEYFSIPS